MSCTISADIAWESFCQNNYKNIAVKDDKDKLSENVIPKSSAIYISTQTKIAFLNQEIKLSDVFWKIPVMKYQSRECGIIKKQMKVNCHSLGDVAELEEKISKEETIQVDIISQINNPNARKLKFKDVRKINIGLCKKDLLCLRKKKKGAMMNCFVLILRLKYKDGFKEVHIKVFNTGKIRNTRYSRGNIYDKGY